MLRKINNFRIILIKISGKIEFLHTADIRNKKSILDYGLTAKISSDSDTFGKEIYVYDYNNYRKQNKVVSGNI